MTLIIAHRGLLNGPDHQIENSPNTIEYARSLNYDVEIDLWVKDGILSLGHDSPTYEISIEWLYNLNCGDEKRSHLWIHTKNIEALYHLRTITWKGHMFYHQNDDVVLTNTGYLWTYPGKTLTLLSICVMPEWIGPLEEISTRSVYGFCTDYAEKLKSILS